MRKNKRKNAIEKQKKRMGFTLPEEIKRYIWGALFFLMAAILVLSFFEKAGVAGRIIFSFLNYLIGKSIYLLPVILVISGLVFFLTHYEKFLGGVLLATLLLVLGSSGILENWKSGEKIGRIPWLFSRSSFSSLWSLGDSDNLCFTDSGWISNFLAVIKTN